MYQQVEGFTDVIDAVSKVAGSVGKAVKQIKGKDKPATPQTQWPDEELPQVTVTGRRINPWLIAGAVGVGLLLLSR